MRSRHEDVVTLHQQEIMKLKLTLQRDNDKNQLCKHDLERSNVGVRELEEDVTCLTKQLQLEQQKSKELAEAVVICEAKVIFCLIRLCNSIFSTLSKTVPKLNVCYLPVCFDDTSIILLNTGVN